MKKEANGFATRDGLSEQLCCKCVGPNLERAVHKVALTYDITSYTFNVST